MYIYIHLILSAIKCWFMPLQIFLAFGNYMNSSKRGGVYGFRLQSLDIVSHLIINVGCVCQLKVYTVERLLPLRQKTCMSFFRTLPSAMLSDIFSLHGMMLRQALLCSSFPVEEAQFINLSHDSQGRTRGNYIVHVRGRPTRENDGKKGTMVQLQYVLTRTYGHT